MRLSRNTPIAEEERDFILPATEALGPSRVLLHSRASELPCNRLLAVPPWATPCHGHVRAGTCLEGLSHPQASSSTR